MLKEVVSVVKCKSYDKKQVRKALLDSLKNIDFSFKHGMKVLIKPNLLSASSPEKAITTHPAVVEELCKILKEHKCEIYIGESSFYGTDKAFKVCGIKKLEKYAKIINFESEDKKFFNLHKLRRVPLPKILFNVDLIINLAKLKTHGLTFVTLCIKNLYGCIPGELKQHYHKLLNHPKDFSRFLLHLEETIKPGLNIIDGVIGMEGEGPGASGDKISSGVILTGRSARAVDIIATEIMGFKPKVIYTNRYSKIKRKNIEAVGNGKNARFKFKKPKTYGARFFMFVNSLLPSSKIYFSKDKCRQCHLCEKKCPVQAITLKTRDKFPECNHKKCILCLCCIEVCPHKAVYLQEHWTKKALTQFAKKVLKV